MTINYLNETAITTPGGAGTVGGAIILQGASLLWGLAAMLPAALGLVREVLFKVLGDIDAPSCLPLALCHAASLPETLQTPDHRSILALLSPLPAFPVVWPDINKPFAKYQYAAFIGQGARLNGSPEQCHRVFPSCGLSGADVIHLVANWKLPCNAKENDNKIEK